MLAHPRSAVATLKKRDKNMTTHQNIPQRLPRLPWHVQPGRMSVCYIEDADGHLVATISPTVENGPDVAKQICDAMNGPDLWDTELYQERSTGQIYFGARWKELHEQVMTWEFEQVKHDNEMNRRG